MNSFLLLCFRQFEAAKWIDHFEETTWIDTINPLKWDQLRCDIWLVNISFRIIQKKPEKFFTALFVMKYSHEHLAAAFREAAKIRIKKNHWNIYPNKLNWKYLYVVYLSLIITVSAFSFYNCTCFSTSRTHYNAFERRNHLRKMRPKAKIRILPCFKGAAYRVHLLVCLKSGPKGIFDLIVMVELCLLRCCRSRMSSISPVFMKILCCFIYYVSCLNYWYSNVS